METHIRLGSFDGSNFKVWQQKMIYLLQGMQFACVLSGPLPPIGDMNSHKTYKVEKYND